MAQREYYEPLANGVERLPTELHMFHAAPLVMRSAHWHAQVEVNYIVRGWAHYRMSGHSIAFQQGDLALFWGGLPHLLDDASDDLIYAGGHLPLLHFFRLRLPRDVQAKLMQGATLVTRATDASDPFTLYPEQQRVGVSGEAPDHHSSPIVVRICEFIADNFREDIDSADIARAADVHPKYAMNVFKKSTGMTLNDYVNLMRLSYAQAMLMRNESNVLQVAMDSGFGSLSAFNKSFRRIAGMSPSDFRRDMRGRPVAPVDVSHYSANPMA